MSILITIVMYIQVQFAHLPQQCHLDDESKKKYWFWWSLKGYFNSIWQRQAQLVTLQAVETEKVNILYMLELVNLWIIVSNQSLVYMFWEILYDFSEGKYVNWLISELI